MLNQLVIIGRFVESKENKIKVKVKRLSKNEKGEYKEDIFTFKIWANFDLTMLHKEDLIGIKARIETEKGKIILIAEKITFLSRKQEKGEK